MSDLPDLQFEPFEKKPVASDGRLQDGPEYIVYRNTDLKPPARSDQRWVPYEQRDIDPRNLRKVASSAIRRDYSQSEQSAQGADVSKSTAPPETEGLLNDVDTFRIEAESIIELLADLSIDVNQREALQQTLLDRALIVLPSFKAHMIIARALDLSDLHRERLVQLVIETMSENQEGAVESGRGDIVLRERILLLNEHSFEQDQDRQKAELLLRQFLPLELLSALGELLPEQMKWLQILRTQCEVATTTLAKDLLSRQYDPIDVARILRIITAHPSITLKSDAVR